MLTWSVVQRLQGKCVKLSELDDFQFFQLYLFKVLFNCIPIPAFAALNVAGKVVITIIGGPFILMGFQKFDLASP